MTEQDKKKFKTVPAMDMDEYKQKIREHRLKILKRTLVTALIISLSGFAPLRRF